MRRVRQVLVAVTLSGVLVGGGAALAHAATAKASPTPSSSSPTTRTHSRNTDNCPHM